MCCECVRPFTAFFPRSSKLIRKLILFNSTWRPGASCLIKFPSPESDFLSLRRGIWFGNSKKRFPRPVNTFISFLLFVFLVVHIGVAHHTRVPKPLTFFSLVLLGFSSSSPRLDSFRCKILSMMVIIASGIICSTAHSRAEECQTLMSETS